MASKLATSVQPEQSLDEDERISPGRSRPFTQAELAFMVKYLDNHKYDSPAFGNSYKRKTRIMRKLSLSMASKFGIKHSRRQLVKRFSDLKVRQKRFLKTLREHYAHQQEEQSEDGHSSEEEANDLPENSQTVESEVATDAMFVGSGTSELDKHHQEVQGCEQQFVTLTLTDVTDENAISANQINDGQKDNSVILDQKVLDTVVSELLTCKEVISVLMVKIDGILGQLGQ